MKIQALVFRQPWRPEIETLELPSMGPRDCLVKICYSGVSIGTESSIISGERTHNGTFPLVSGYMASGIIEAIGSAVEARKPGDRVAVWGTAFASPVNSVWGAHASYHLIPETGTTLLPEGTSLKDAAMWILPRVGLNAVSMANVTETDTVLINGQGLIGQFCGQWAKARGADVIVTDINPFRLKLAEKYVTRKVLNPLDGNVAETISGLTAGLGPDVVVEATGNKKLLPSATAYLTKMHARMVFLSWYSGAIEFPYAHFHNQEVTAFFPMGAGEDATTGRAVLQGLADGTITMGENITDCYDYSEAAKGYERIAAHDGTIMGMILDWRNA